jgi:hypothetical protein
MNIFNTAPHTCVLASSLGLPLMDVFTKGRTYKITEGVKLCAAPLQRTTDHIKMAATLIVIIVYREC